MMMFERNLARRSARGELWGKREDLLPHLLNHQCPVRAGVEELCILAEWTYESYLLAAWSNAESCLLRSRREHTLTRCGAKRPRRSVGRGRPRVVRLPRAQDARLRRAGWGPSRGSAVWARAQVRPPLPDPP